MSGLWSQFGAAVEQRATTAATSSGGVGTLTFSSAHGLRPGDIIVLTGGTPSGWNGTYVVATVPTTTTLTIATPSNPATATVQPTVTGYGMRGVTVGRFWEYNSEGVRINPGRIKSQGLRAGARQVRSDRSIPYVIDATGNVEMDVMSRGFGFWLQQMLGSISIAMDTPASGVQTMTATLGELVGVSFAAQIGLPYTGAPGSGLSPSVVPKNLYGCKVAGWQLSCEKGGAVKLQLTIDSQHGDHAGTIAVASYPTCEPLTFLGAAVTIGGVAVNADKVTLAGSNPMRTDGAKLRNSAAKREPFVNAYRDISVSVDLDFDSLTHQTRVLATTAAGTVTAFGVTFAGVGEIATGVVPSLAIAAPAVQWDGDTPQVAGPDLVPETLNGMVLDTGASLITATYITLDTVA